MVVFNFNDEKVTINFPGDAYGIDVIENMNPNKMARIFITRDYQIICDVCINHMT